MKLGIPEQILAKKMSHEDLKTLEIKKKNIKRGVFMEKKSKANERLNNLRGATITDLDGTSIGKPTYESWQNEKEIIFRNKNGTLFSIMLGNFWRLSDDNGLIYSSEEKDNFDNLYDELKNNEIKSIRISNTQNDLEIKFKYVYTLQLLQMSKKIHNWSVQGIVSCNGKKIILD